MNSVEWAQLNSFFITLAAGTVVRSLVLAGFCGGAVWLLRSRRAALRFSLWKWTLLALFALPVLLCLAPPPVPHAVRTFTNIQVARLPQPIAQTVHTVAPQPQRSFVAPKVSPWVLAYAAMALLLLARLAHNLVRLEMLARTRECIPDSGFRELAHQLWLESEARLIPNFAASSAVQVPVTFHTSSDVWILLPQHWREWDEQKLRVVLTHELAHVARGDSQTLLMASLAACLFWFYPLTWFVRRRLAGLAEEACDQEVLARTTTPEGYSQILIEFAQDAQRLGGRRISLPAAAVVRKSNLQQRLERLFIETRPLKAWLAAGFVTLFAGTIYLSAAARLIEPQAEKPDMAFMEFLSSDTGIDPKEVSALQADIQVNPENIEARAKLLNFYATTKQEAPFVEQALWMVNHRPSSFGMFFIGVMYRNLSARGYEQLRAAWDAAALQHPESSGILQTAAIFIEKRDALRALALFRQAQVIEPKNPSITLNLANIYAAAELQGIGSKRQIDEILVDPQAGVQIRAELAASQDPALLEEVARLVAGEPSADAVARELLDRANAIDPAGRDRRVSIEQLRELARTVQERMELPHGTIRLAPDKAESALIHSEPPVYPPLGKSARVQGTVEFEATIGTDGKVSGLRLVRGHPLLVNAAKEAVLKSVYSAPTQNGERVPFTTQIMVKFELP